jgi:hypothetical protein
MTSIFIIYPIYKYAEPDSERCLEKMIQYMSEKGYRIGLDKPIGESLVTRARNRSLGKFVRDGNFDWFLSIDSDIVFNESLLEVLLSHKKEVIGAVYRVKQNKIVAACVPIKDEKIEMNKGLQEMRFLSAGCMLINMSVIMEMVEKYSELKYYDDYSDEEIWGLYNLMIVKHKNKNRLLSEDWSFCRRMSDIGVNLYVDTNVRLGHMMMTPLVFPKAKE